MLAGDHPVFQNRDIVSHLADFLSAQETARLSLVGKKLHTILHFRLTQLFCESKYPELGKQQVHWICLQEKPRDWVDGVVRATRTLKRLRILVDGKGNGTGCDFIPGGAWLAGSLTRPEQWVQACPNLDEKALAALYIHAREKFAQIYMEGTYQRSPLLAQLAVDFVLRGWLESLKDDLRHEKLLVKLVTDLATFQLERREAALQIVMEQIGERPEVLNRCLAEFFSSCMTSSAHCPLVLEELLKNGADVRFRAEGGRTIGERALRKGLREEEVRAALRVCIRYGDQTLHEEALVELKKCANQIEVLNFLHEVGAYRMGMRDKKGEGALHYLARTDFTELAAIKWALDLGEDADARDNKGVSPLQVAVMHHLGRDLQQILDTLIKHGADRQPVTTNGSTTLHLVCQHRNWLYAEGVARVIGLYGGVLTTNKEGKRPLDYLAGKCTRDPFHWAPIVKLFIAEGETFWEEDGAFKKWSADEAFLLAVAGGCLDHLRQWPAKDLPLEHYHQYEQDRKQYPVHLAAGNADIQTLKWLVDRGANLEHGSNIESLIATLTYRISSKVKKADLLATVRFLKAKTDLPVSDYHKLLERLIECGMYTAFFEIAKMIDLQQVNMNPYRVNWECCDEDAAEKLLQWLAKHAPEWKPKHWTIIEAHPGNAVEMMVCAKREWLLEADYVPEICKLLVSHHNFGPAHVTRAHTLLVGLRTVRGELEPDEWQKVTQEALNTLLDHSSLFRTPIEILEGSFDLFLDLPRLAQDRRHQGPAIFQLFRTIGKEGINKAHWQLLRSHLDRMEISFGNHGALVALCESPVWEAFDSPMMEEYLEVAPQIVEWICNRISTAGQEVQKNSPLAVAVTDTRYPKLGRVLVKALLQKGFSAKGTNGKGESALQIACENGDRASVMLMLEAKPELEEQEKRDLLRYAHKSGNLRLLLDLDTYFGQELKPTEPPQHYCGRFPGLW